MPSLGPTTLFSHSNCLFMPGDTSLEDFFLAFSARLAEAPVRIRNAIAADAASLNRMGTSKIGKIGKIGFQVQVGSTPIIAYSDRTATTLCGRSSITTLNYICATAKA